MKGYYTPQKAREVLGGISPNKLRKYVQSGKLHRKVPPGGTQGLYSIDEVEALAQEIRDFYGGKQIIDKEDSHGRFVYRARGSAKAASG